MEREPWRVGTWIAALGLLAALLAFLTLTFKHLAYPLAWHDEGDTLMFAQRVLEYGYPKVHGENNVVYGLRPELKDGELLLRTSGGDAYTGAPWASYYFGAPAVALARSVDDLYLKTALVRLPFALIGVLGLALWLWVLSAAIEGGRTRRLLFAACWWAACAYSVSLILHLREARYYGLVVFLACALLTVFVRHQVQRRLSPARYALLTTGLLFGLFNTFYPAFAAFVAALGLHALGRALRGPGDGAARWRAALAAALPLATALALTLPLLLYFDFLAQTGGWLEEWGSSFGDYLANLRTVALNLARYELAIAALGLRALVALGPDRSDTPEAQQRRRIASFLLLFVSVYATLLAVTPFIWERYFICLSPAITAMALLDAWTLATRLRSLPRRRAWALAALASLLWAGSLFVRLPDLRGRIHEITHRYRGPLDHIIPYLQEQYADPARLVIATNYEETVYMFYLGSRVTIGYYGANLPEDLRVQPDVIVFRPWRDQRRALAWLASRAEYRSREFPVQSTMTNNLPGLSPRSPGGMTHRFATPEPEPGRPLATLLERVR